MSSYRKKCMDEKGSECITCGSDENLEVHHLDGDRTNNSLDNLIPLCRSCHRALHTQGLNGLEEQLLPVDERRHIDSSTTSFQLAIERGKWDDWKDTVPRSKSLEQRIIELIEADTEGRVCNDD